MRRAVRGHPPPDRLGARAVVVALVRHRLLVAVGAWIFHVAALAMAPLSLVQAVLSGGVVLLAVMAERLFGFSVGPRQWLGVGLTAVGLCLLVITLPPRPARTRASRSRA